MFDIQTCPRRMNEVGPWEHEENLDSWLEGDRGSEEAHQPDPEPYCSFCGSLHPEKFLELIAEGWVVEPTDKTYKAYLGEVLHGPERIAMPGEPLPPIRCGRAKFYYQHFTEDQMQKFVDLYNNNTMRLGYPGYFYQLPFFMALGQADKS
ncbi:hypothetical protein ACFW2V_13070 [Streptomyces sp. NPDC058947]|uniref:hypothetical protein n=1 Tax=Streptomyces sp. NPDC058947 TaxID=3346675 RepID=UPI00368E2B95